MKCPNCQTENPEGAQFCEECGHPLIEQSPTPLKPPSPKPTSFAGGRYQVKKKLGEGGKKKVYLTHDTVLDRDVAFAMIKTENLDEDARKRQRLGATQLKGVKEKKTRGNLFVNKDNILYYLLYHTIMVVPTHEKLIRRPAM